jgi:LmbE family N-acetylglucosaminyl deacetylase
VIALEARRIRRLLCLGAHSDDIEIGAGGTIRHLLAANPELEVRWVVLSAEGHRAEEARRSAAALLGPGREAAVELSELQDGHFPEQRREVKRRLEELRETGPPPDLILCTHREDAHQDHRTLAELAWTTFRDHLVLEYEVPKYDGDLGRPSVYVPLADELARAKVEHLMAQFESQRTKPWYTADVFWALLRLRGVECREPFAEAFHARKLVIS